MRWFIIHTLVVIGILVLGVSPFIPVAIAGTMAERNGCTLHEGFVNPCVINGEDWGETLYSMGMMGWIGIATIPLAIGVAGIYIIVVIIISLVQYARRRNAAKAQTQIQIPPN